MLKLSKFAEEMNEMLDELPAAQAIALARFNEAFDELDDEQRKTVRDKVGDLLVRVLIDLRQFGQTALYDTEIEEIVAEVSDFLDNDALFALRRGALRDIIATKMKAKGLEVTRRKDGDPRLVVSLV